MLNAIHITVHAAERYRERFAPGATEREADQLMAESLARAVLVRCRTAVGDECWEDGDVVFVVRRDPNPYCTTVLDRRERGHWDPFLEEVERYGVQPLSCTFPNGPRKVRGSKRRCRFKR